MKLLKTLFLLTIVSTVACLNLDAAQHPKKRKTKEDQEHEHRDKKARSGCIRKALSTLLSLIPQKKTPKLDIVTKHDIVDEKFTEEAKQALDLRLFTNLPDDPVINILSFIAGKEAISILSLVNKQCNRLVPLAAISLTLGSPYQMGKEDEEGRHQVIKHNFHSNSSNFSSGISKIFQVISSKTLSKYTKLQKLTLPKKANNLDIFTIVSSLKELQHLSLLSSGITYKSLPAICSLQQLTSLELPYASVREGEWKELTPCIARGTMKSLVLNNTQISDADLESWADHLSNVEYLNLNHCRLITLAGIQKLFPYLENIKCLQLRGCGHLDIQYQKIFVEEGYDAFAEIDQADKIAPLEELRNLLKEAAQSSS